MKGCLTLLMVLVFTFVDDFVVYANDNTEVVWIEGLNDAWSNKPYEITVNVLMDDRIKEIKVYKMNGGYLEEKFFYEVNGASDNFCEKIMLGDAEQKLYEGITDWMVSATSVDGDFYYCWFELKLDYTNPVISTDLFGDYGFEVLFDYRESIIVWAEDEESGVELFKINPSYSQNKFVSDRISPYIVGDEFKVNYIYPEGEEYGYVLYAKDRAGNYSTRIIMTRYNITSKLKRIIPRRSCD